MDLEKIEQAVTMLLEGIGEDPNREGLKETPKRVARMYEEVFEGIKYSNHEIANMFGKTFEEEDRGGNDIIVLKDISIFSYCEHHLALMYDMKVNVSYVPKGRVIGLSKIVRICEMAAKRLQLQERLTNDIADIIMEATGAEDVAVQISGYHSCVAARGIKNVSTKTVTQTFRGAFKDDYEMQKKIQ